MRNIDQLKEQLEALESLSMSQLSLDMPKPAPSLLRGVMELLEAQQEEIVRLREIIYEIPEVRRIRERQEEEAATRYWNS